MVGWLWAQISGIPVIKFISSAIHIRFYFTFAFQAASPNSLSGNDLRPMEQSAFCHSEGQMFAAARGRRFYVDERWGQQTKAAELEAKAATLWPEKK
ncbi:MAG: hypothetical protein ABIO24_02300 [Saprospiraceae bacterium]